MQMNEEKLLKTLGNIYIEPLTMYQKQEIIKIIKTINTTKRDLHKDLKLFMNNVQNGDRRNDFSFNKDINKLNNIQETKDNSLNTENISKHITRTIDMLLEQLRPIENNLTYEQSLDQLTDEQIELMNILYEQIIRLETFKRNNLEQILTIKGVGTK